MFYCEDTKEIANSYQEYLKTKHWQNVTNKYFVSHRIVCRRCPCEFGIELHHVNYNNVGNEKDTDLIPLCHNCHGNAHGYISEYSKMMLQPVKYKKIRKKKSPLKQKMSSKDRRNYINIYLSKFIRRRGKYFSNK